MTFEDLLKANQGDEGRFIWDYLTALDELRKRKSEDKT